MENPVTNSLVKILNSNIALAEIVKNGGTVMSSTDVKAMAGVKKRIIDAWNQMQLNVNMLMDNTSSASAKRANSGIRQVLEKKEGLFRRHRMGKRVNFAARSVISPDPYIKTNEIGLPLYFAKRLSYPEPVTPYNVKRLRAAVENGADKWFGANFVEEKGRMVDLSRM